MKLQKIIVGAMIFASSLCAHAIDIKERMAIFPQEYMSAHYENTLMPWPYSYWTPSLDEVQKINVLEYLEKQNLLTEIMSFDSYAFQYYGILDKDKKTIEIQAACTNGARDWKHDLYLVKGGGKCFFHLSYDVESRKISGFYVNAPK